MWSGVTDAWTETVTGSHRAVCRIDVLGPDRGFLTSLAPHSGSVRVDARRAITRTLSGLSVADADGTLTPTEFDDLLSPFSGNMIAPYRGAVVDGTATLAPLGVFPITRAAPDVTREGTVVAVEASGVAQRLSELTMDTPYITAAADTAEAIRSLLMSRWADAPLDLTTTGFTASPITLDIGDDPYRVARDLAAAAGQELIEDSDGYIRNRAVPNPIDLTAAASYGTGEAPLLAHTRPFDLAGMYSGVTVVAENSNLSTSVAVTLWDTDPTSATNVNRIGRRARRVNLPGIGSAAQAEAAAAAELRKQSGYAAVIDADVVPNPAHDPYDGVRFITAGFDAVLLLDSFTVPLTVKDSMAVTARQRPEVSG